eukprot:m.417073 g.417073  ORF g.417073 m.417073 type:complete len:300 (-) comp30252_c0_seq1:331-1230(-)
MARPVRRRLPTLFGSCAPRSSARCGRRGAFSGTPGTGPNATAGSRRGCDMVVRTTSSVHTWSSCPWSASRRSRLSAVRDPHRIMSGTQPNARQVSIIIGPSTLTTSSRFRTCSRSNRRHSRISGSVRDMMIPLLLLGPLTFRSRRFSRCSSAVTTGASPRVARRSWSHGSDPPSPSTSSNVSCRAAEAVRCVSAEDGGGGGGLVDLVVPVPGTTRSGWISTWISGSGGRRLEVPLLRCDEVTLNNLRGVGHDLLGGSPTHNDVGPEIKLGPFEQRLHRLDAFSVHILDYTDEVEQGLDL